LHQGETEYGSSSIRHWSYFIKTLELCTGYNYLLSPFIFLKGFTIRIL
jgi:hypothetical protein